MSATAQDNARKLVAKIAQAISVLSTDLERLSITDVCDVPLAATAATVVSEARQYALVFSKTPLDSHTKVYRDFWVKHRRQLKALFSMLPTLLKSGDTDAVDPSEIVIGVMADDEVLKGYSIDIRWLLLASIKVDLLESQAHRKTLDALHDIARLTACVLSDVTGDKDLDPTAIKNFAIEIHAFKSSATATAGPADNMLGGIVGALQGFENHPQLAMIMQSVSTMLPTMARSMKSDISEEELDALSKLDLSGAIKGVMTGIATGKPPTEVFESINASIKAATENTPAAIQAPVEPSS